MASAFSPQGTTRYTTVAIVLHWAIAAALIFEVGLGLRMVDLRGSARFAPFQLHKSVGITILLLVALRLVWRFYRDPPPLATSGWERALARAVHALFYVLLFALPLSGWLIVSTSRIAVPTLLYGAIPLPHLPGFSQMMAAAKAAWNGVGVFTHHSLVYVLYGSFALHVAGALKHHFLDHDGEMARMVPGTKSGAWLDPRLVAITLGVVLLAGLGLRWAPIGPAATAAAPQIAQAPIAPELPAPAKAAPPAAVSENASAPAKEEPPGKSSAPAAEALSSWAISPGSTLHFRTTWSGDTIAGGFNHFDGDIVFGTDALDRSHVEIRVSTSSVFSGDAQRDETLKSADWFSAASFGTATFSASKFRKIGANAYIASGTLRLKGATLPISLPFSLDIKGDKATMRGTATVDRTAYKIGEGEYASTAEIPAAVSVDVAVRATRTK